MNFLSQGKKLKALRIKYGIGQKDLEASGVSRNFISMCESDKRKLSKSTAISLLTVFKNKAKELGKELDIDEKYFLLTPKEDAKIYCFEKLKNVLTIEDIENLEKIANEHKLFNVLPYIYLKKADLMYNEKKLLEAIMLYNNAADDFNILNIKVKIPYINNQLGKCKAERLDYTEALCYFQKAYDSAYIINDKDISIRSLYNIARTYKKMEQFETALFYLEKFFSAFTIEDNYDMYLMASILKGNCFNHLGDLIKATNIYELALSLINNNNSIWLGFIYDNLAFAYLEIGNINKSLEYFNKSENFRENYDNKSLHQIYIDKANIYIKEKKYIEAVLLLEKGIDLSIRNKDNEYILTAYKMLEKIYIFTNEDEKLEMIYNKILKMLNSKNNESEVMRTLVKLSLLKSKEVQNNGWKEYLIKVVDLNKKEQVTYS